MGPGYSDEYPGFFAHFCSPQGLHFLSIKIQNTVNNITIIHKNNIFQKND